MLSPDQIIMIDIYSVEEKKRHEEHQFTYMLLLANSHVPTKRERENRKKSP